MCSKNIQYTDLFIFSFTLQWNGFEGSWKLTHKALIFIESSRAYLEQKANFETTSCLKSVYKTYTEINGGWQDPKLFIN